MIGYHNDGLRIINSHFVNLVLVERSQIMINKLNLFFTKPKIILAYMHYDSRDSFSYTLIENGSDNRFRYSLSTDWFTHDFEYPLDVEINILNGEI